MKRASSLAHYLGEDLSPTQEAPPIHPALITAAHAASAHLATAGHLLADHVHMTPTGQGAPGAAFVQTAINWLAQYALWASLAALLVGGATYGFSTYAGNSYRAAHGRSVVLAGAVGAVVTGLGPTAINLLFRAAS